MSKARLVPRLRFPEFRDAGEWKSAQLDDLISTVTPPKKIPTSDYLLEGQFPVIDQGQSDIAGWINDPDAIVETSQPLIVFGDHTCALKLISRSFAQGADGIKIIKGSGLADTAFLYQFLCFRPVVSEEYKRHFSILKTKVAAYPDRKSGEQKKIADCLTSLDELITLEAQKLNTLKTHKKGLMQQLFPAEGETLPKLRFPEFLVAGEWEEKLLSAVCDMQAGKFVVAAEIFDQKGNSLYPCFGGNGLRGYTKTYTHSGRYSLIGRQGALCGNVNLVDGIFHATEHAVVTSPKTGIHTDWLFYKLVLLNLNRFATGQAQPGLSVDVLNKVACVAPRDEREQQKIADCLASLDDLITAQTQKLAVLKTHKKGLMQQLFPNTHTESTP